MRVLPLLLVLTMISAEEEDEGIVVDGLADRILSIAHQERAAGRLPEPERYPTADLNWEPPWLRDLGWHDLPWDLLERDQALQVLDLLYKHAENQWYTNMRRHRLDRSIQQQLDSVRFRDGDVRKRMPTMFVERWSHAMGPQMEQAARQRSEALTQALEQVRQALDAEAARRR